MKYEKILPQLDGSKIRAIVSFYDNDFVQSYRIELFRCEKGKRTYYRPYDEDSYTHRALTMDQRREKVKEAVIDILGKETYNGLLLESWEQLKPELI